MRIHLEPGNFITFFAGLGFIAAGIYGYQYMGRFLETAREAPGVVVEVVYETGTKKGRIHPVVRYTTSDGREVIGRSQEHHNVHPGDTVRLLYDPRNPTQIDIDTLQQAQRRRLLFTTLCVLLGFVVCGFGLALDMGSSPGSETVAR